MTAPRPRARPRKRPPTITERLADAETKAMLLSEQNLELTATLERLGAAGDIEGARFTVEATKRLEKRNADLANALREALEMLVANSWSPKAYQRLQKLL